MEEHEFFDTVSLSQVPLQKRRSSNKDYISLSRNTIYHSAVDLDAIEMKDISQEKVKVSKHPKTYFQWRDRVIIKALQKNNWRNFSSDALDVDFVLAYEEDSNTEKLRKREVFEANLKEVGLLLEKEERQRIHFVKIHVPRNVICQYAEILKLRLPLKTPDHIEPSKNFIASAINKCFDFLNVRLDEKKFPPKRNRLRAEFSRDKFYLFDMEAPDFFNTSVRITVVSYILEREQFGKHCHDKGIKRLLSENIYKAAYPLHDGDVHHKGSMRNLLFEEWAAVSKLVKYQPIDDIKDYFGVKFALYFAWLGFYTHMLIPASIVGLLSLLYGWFTYSTDRFSQDICQSDVVMCPLCDRICSFWKLSEGCTYSRIAHFIDNPMTIFFAVFMSVWATIYLELWKRYSAEITHRWGLTGFDLQAEPPRPEYLTRLHNAKKKKLNVVTLLDEPAVSFWKVKLPSIIFSFSVAILWICLALATVVGVVIYRMALISSESLYSDKTSYRIYVVPATAALINLSCIVLLNVGYDRLAEFLTEMELQRTQTEYDDSLALKIYMFQFVNYYSSIFYIAFLKGKFVGYPSKYNRIFGYRQEECNPGGCLMELTIQLTIIMIGNQAINSILEMVLPLLFKLYNTITIKTGLKALNDNTQIIGCNQWTEDFKLNSMDNRSLFTEYLEMILQYGFVTIFVTAFPLAPLFALINNMLEMRLDAKKFIKYFRRPVPQRVRDIGVWMPLMNIVGRISVASNAFIIAFSSNFIPKLVYMLRINPSRTDEGYLNHTLAYFDIKDFPNNTAPVNNPWNVTVCRYTEYRNPPDDVHRYKRSVDYWHILAARLAFVVVYQNLVTFIITIIEWVIPDIPRRLSDQIKREAYKTNDTIINYEKDRAREKLRMNRNSVLSGDSVYTDVFDTNGTVTHGEANPLYHRNVHTTTTEL